MKLALLSDIHGNYTALQVALQALDAEEGIDQTWVLGDLSAHGPQPDLCATTIRERHEADKDHFKVIGGNTDRYLVTNARMAFPAVQEEENYAAHQQKAHQQNLMLDWAQQQLSWVNYAFLSKILGREVGETVPGYGLVLGYHAVPGDDEYNVTPQTPDEEARDSVLDRPLRMGIYGHIHRQVHRELGGITLVNPGSVGLSFEQPGMAQFAILTVAEGEAKVDFRNVPYDVNQVLQLAEDAGHPAVGFLQSTLQEES